MVIVAIKLSYLLYILKWITKPQVCPTSTQLLSTVLHVCSTVKYSMLSSVFSSVFLYGDCVNLYPAARGL